MKRSGGGGMIAVLLLVCVFAVTLLLVLSTGATVYRQVESRVEESGDRRVGLTYITAKIHSGDQQNGVSAAAFDGVDAVCLTEEIDGTDYETWLYVYNGWLRELFCARDSGLEPRDGETITEAQSLTVQEEDGLLTLTYVDGTGAEETAQVFLRSGGTV
jgi:hypothetical protein